MPCRPTSRCFAGHSGCHISWRDAGAYCSNSSSDLAASFFARALGKVLVDPCFYLLKAKQKQRDAIEGNRPNRTSFTADNEWVHSARISRIEVDPASHCVAAVR